MIENNADDALTAKVLNWLMDYTGYMVEARHIRIQVGLTGVVVEPADLVGDKVMKRIAQLDEMGKLVSLLLHEPISCQWRMEARLESELAAVMQSGQESYSAAQVIILLRRMLEDLAKFSEP